MKTFTYLLVTLLLAIGARSAVLERYFDSRIANGYPAKPGQFPHQVLLLGDSGSGIYICGGTIISDRYVMTAAHCTDNIRSFQIHAGSHKFQSSNEPDRVVLRSSEILIHEAYNSYWLHNDIALIKTSETIPFNARIQPAKLAPAVPNTYEGSIVVASGWGRLSDNGSIAPELQYGVFRVIGNEECRSHFGNTITDGTVCAVGKDLVSVCFGDSGGPLVLNGTNTIIGITSFVSSQMKCSSARPNGFARVSQYLGWIATKSGVTPNRFSSKNIY